MHYLVVAKDRPDSIHADLTITEWASYGAKYPSERFDVYTTTEDVFAPGPVPDAKTLVERDVAPLPDRVSALEARVFDIDNGGVQS